MPQYLTQGVSLTQYSRQVPTIVFDNAQTYPDFFQQHLVDPNRVIKILADDPHAFERIFYYQYLKLCQQLQEEDSRQLISNIIELIQHPEFYFIFPDSEKGQPFSDSQFKRFIHEFMAIVSSGQMPFDQAIEIYPIIDLAFTYIMRSLLIFNEKAADCDEYVDKNETLAYLSTFFNLEIQEFGNCLKFVDSDVFVYEESPYRVYMVFIKKPPSYLEENDEKITQTVIQNIVPAQKSNQLVPPSANRKRNQIYTSAVSSGIYEFVDFTNNAASDGANSLAKKVQSKPLFESVEDLSSHVNKQKAFCKTSMELPQIPKQVQQEHENPDEDASEESLEDNAFQDQNHFLSVVLPNNRPARQPAHENTAINTDKKALQIKIEDAASQHGKDLDDYSDISSGEFDPKALINLPSLETLDKTPRRQEANINQHLHKQTKAQMQQLPQKVIEKKFVPHIKPAQQASKYLAKHEQPKLTDDGRITEQSNPSVKNLGSSGKGKNEALPSMAFIKVIPSNELGFTAAKHRIVSKGRLNVTQDFTNSFVLKNMTEPHRRNTAMARERARAYRTSVRHLFAS